MGSAGLEGRGVKQPPPQEQENPNEHDDTHQPASLARDNQDEMTGALTFFHGRWVWWVVPHALRRGRTAAVFGARPAQGWGCAGGRKRCHRSRAHGEPLRLPPDKARASQRVGHRREGPSVEEHGVR